MKKIIFVSALFATHIAFATTTYLPLICTISDGNVVNRVMTFSVKEVVINNEKLKIPVVTNLAAMLQKTKDSCKWETGRITYPIPDSVGLQVKEGQISGSTIYGNGSTIGGTPAWMSIPGWTLQPKKKYRFWVDQYGIVDSTKPIPEDLGY